MRKTEHMPNTQKFGTSSPKVTSYGEGRAEIISFGQSTPLEMMAKAAFGDNLAVLGVVWNQKWSLLSKLLAIACSQYP